MNLAVTSQPVIGRQRAVDWANTLTNQYVTSGCSTCVALPRALLSQTYSSGTLAQTGPFISTLLSNRSWLQVPYST